MTILIASWFGLIMGSFISALTWRLHEQNQPQNGTHSKKRTRELSISRGRSLCPHCGHRLSWLDLVPILSWVSLRGRCRYCHRSISAIYPLIELTTGVLFALIVYRVGFATTTSTLESTLWLGATVALVALAIYDLRWKLLPNVIIFPLIAWVAVIRLLQAVLLDEGALFVEPILGGLALFGVFAGIFYLSRGKWLGGGDVKLAAFMGVALGWQLGFLALMLAAWLGTAVVVVMALRNGMRIDRRQQIAFGPLLIIGTYLALFYGQPMIDWYQSTLV
jgi:prepilin signal peptidase PulO-like enzyme (type II secretory pathway)